MLCGYMMNPVFTDIMAMFVYACGSVYVCASYSQWCQGGLGGSYIRAAVSEAVSPLPID